MKCIDIPLNGYFCYLHFRWYPSNTLTILMDKDKSKNTVKGIRVSNIKKIEKYLFLKKLEKDVYKVRNNGKLIHYVPLDTKKKLLDFLELLKIGYGGVSYQVERKDLMSSQISRKEFIELYDGICNI